MLTDSVKKKSIKAKSKKYSPSRRIKSAKRRLTRRIAREGSAERNVKSRGTNLSYATKNTNMSTSHKYIANNKSIQQSMNASYNTTTVSKGRKKRIYSAKPTLQDSRRFTKYTQRPGKEPYMMQISPSEKKMPETSFVRFSAQTAPSSEFQRSFYNPYQTMTKLSDNFLNIEKSPMVGNMTNLMSRASARSSESTISTFTVVQNSKTTSELQVLDQIREKNSVANELSNLKHVDCGKLLMSANQQMKKINYRLNNLISNGDNHLAITRNEPKEIEILDGIPFLCKVGCKGLAGPAKFIMKHKTKGKVKSYVSLNQNVTPHYKSDSNRFQVFPEDGEKAFGNDFIFLMFTSLHGCVIQLTVDFPNEDDKYKKKKETKEQTDEEKYEAKLARCIIKRPSKPRQDKIEENIRKMSFWNRISAQERQAKSHAFRMRREAALIKKEQLFMQKIKHNIYYMNRWDIVREKRKDIERAQRHQERKELYKFWWVRQTMAVMALRTVFNTFETTKNAIYQEYKEKLFAKRIIRKFDKYLQERAPTLEERLLNNVRHTQTACVPFMKDICEQRSKSVLTDFITVASMNFETKRAFTKFHEKVSLIQRNYLQLRENYAHRAEVLTKRWEKESEAMILYCAKHKGKNKKFKTLLKKLQTADDAVKERMIKYYLQKLKFEHMVRVFEWTKRKMEDKGQEFQSIDEMQFLITVIGHMNKFLYKGVDNAILDIEFKKEQKALEKARKIENKHGAEGHTAKNRQGSASPTKAKEARPETGKPSAKNKFAYIPLEEVWLNWPHPPGFRFDTDKREMQIMIKKACNLKSIEEIILNPMDMLKKAD